MSKVNAVIACVGMLSLGGSSAAADIPEPAANRRVISNWIYQGYTFYGAKAPAKNLMYLQTSNDGQRLMVAVGYYRAARRCATGYRGQVLSTFELDKRWLKITSDGRFSGDGSSHSKDIFDEVMRFRWHVTGQFTADGKRAAGKLRISAQDGELRCPTLTVPWKVRAATNPRDTVMAEATGYGAPDRGR